MTGGRTNWRTLCFVVLSALAVLVTPACGGAQPGKKASITSGPMPDGGSWDGVYFNPLYGYLHLKRQGDQVKGKWKRTVGDKWGQLEGKIDGNVIRFEWTEHTIGLIGPNATRKGRGYFKYSRPEGDNVDDRIDGQIGAGEDEVGETWDGVKQRRMEPDLASIGTSDDVTEGGGGFDEATGGDKSTDEAPPADEAPPPPLR